MPYDSKILEQAFWKTQNYGDQKKKNKISGSYKELGPVMNNQNTENF